MEQEELIEFFPFTSVVNSSFWHKFTEIKLDVDKLSDSGRKIWGYFSNLNLNPCKSVVLEVDSTSFNLDCNLLKTYIPVHGELLNKNTIEQFKDCDKQELINSKGALIWEKLNSEDVFKNPSLLNFFLILSFADLKKYHYYYWFCFPALSKVNVKLVKIVPVESMFNKLKIRAIHEEYNKLDYNHTPFFIIKHSDTSTSVLKLNNIKNITSDSDVSEYYFAFSDPSVSPKHPGWPLRNYIVFLLRQCPFLSTKKLNFLAVRLTRGEGIINITSSLVFLVKLPPITFDSSSPENSWIGWEKNERGKFGARRSDMKNSMDPKCLAESAVDLNLKLMKWQLLPDIDLEKIKRTKCLLLGSGTLGCSVARTLLGWGVRHMTFVDNATVSFSNPVRQTLFVYEDCVTNKPKAEAAAENLAKIFPGVISKGYHLSIPMPGHPVGESLLAQTEENVKTLKTLILDNDIIFLLMDSRESRWLPTLLGACLNKTVINAALGFDTYLVMRHGCRHTDDFTMKTVESGTEVKAIPGCNLGCYFCNDVTAPGNSLKDRTLDQQCTVTRPGVSAICGALAVELAVSLLQHPEGANAPAFYRAGSQELGLVAQEDCMLGIVPHSIRGFLSTFSNVLPATEKYKQCIACSDLIVDEYEKNGFKFLLEVFNSCQYLEKITGLSELQKEISDLEVWDLDDDDED